MSETEQPHASAEEVIAGVDLTGKVALVTGASAGLGVETAAALAGAGAEVVMLARDAAKTEAAMAQVRERHPAARLSFQALDLADLDSVRQAADALLARYDAIHLLIANAGVMACPLGRTREGCEWQFGVNHIGHFLFVCKLVPALLAAAPARVVVLSSAGHRYSAVDFEDPHFERRDYDKWIAYGQAKTANILFALELNQRLQSRGVKAYSVHPGAIMTELGRYLDSDDYEFINSQSKDGAGFSFKSPAQGAATSIWAAVAPELEEHGGAYLHDCRIAEVAEDDSGGAEAGVRPWARDAEAARRLWILSEEIVGEPFPLK